MEAELIQNAFTLFFRRFKWKKNAFFFIYFAFEQYQHEILLIFISKLLYKMLAMQRAKKTFAV